MNQVFVTGGWQSECDPKDLLGLDKLFAAEPTRLHPFLAIGLS